MPGAADAQTSSHRSQRRRDQPNSCGPGSASRRGPRAARGCGRSRPAGRRSLMHQGRVPGPAAPRAPRVSDPRRPPPPHIPWQTRPPRWRARGNESSCPLCPGSTRRTPTGPLALHDTTAMARRNFRERIPHRRRSQRPWGFGPTFLLCGGGRSSLSADPRGWSPRPSAEESVAGPRAYDLHGHCPRDGWTVQSGSSMAPASSGWDTGADHRMPHPPTHRAGP